MTPAAMLAGLQAWRDAGWLRPLDLAFAGFVHGLDAQAPASLLLAAALLAQLEGRGHSCLPVAAIGGDPGAVLGWPAAAAETLTAALASWPADAAAARAAWGDREVLQVDPVDDSGSSPLVLCGGHLYLRRYWRHETQVARPALWVLWALRARWTQAAPASCSASCSPRRRRRRGSTKRQPKPTGNRSRVRWPCAAA